MVLHRIVDTLNILYETSYNFLARDAFIEQIVALLP